jgi:hypothetical protein
MNKFDIMEDVIAGLRRLHEMDRGRGWQPMSTAPKDGTDILLAFDPTYGYMVQAKWWEKKKGHTWCCSYTNRRIVAEPTYWHALPDQPYTEEEQQDALRARAEASETLPLTDRQMIAVFNRMLGED